MQVLIEEEFGTKTPICWVLQAVYFGFWVHYTHRHLTPKIMDFQSVLYPFIFGPFGSIFISLPNAAGHYPDLRFEEIII